MRPGLGARGDFDRALKALEAGDTARAIELLEAVTAAEPGLAPAFIDLGIAYARDGKLQQAETSLLRAVELNPRHPAAQNELGIVYRRMGRFAEARAAYEAALVLHPSFHHARRNLGILCDLYLADPGCALEQYELYLQAAPEDETVAMWVADLANRLGRSQE
ncbi:MAG: tetratricopeptide repeat protein [Myxococcota bacterium]